MSNEEQKRWKNRRCSLRSGMNSFAKRAIAFLGTNNKKRTMPTKLLDLGCGNGVDSLYFARKGIRTTAMDFSKSGIDTLRERLVRFPTSHTHALIRDISKKLPFRDASFDVVYAHLSLHYFNAKTTPKIFDDVHRVLKRGGMFFVKCKSIDDLLYGKGQKIEENMYLYGHVRHFFSKDYMKNMLHKFDILRLRRSRSFYHSYRAAYIEAIARKKDHTLSAYSH